MKPLQIKFKQKNDYMSLNLKNYLYFAISHNLIIFYNIYNYYKLFNENQNYIINLKFFL